MLPIHPMLYPPLTPVSSSIMLRLTIHCYPLSPRRGALPLAARDSTSAPERRGGHGDAISRWVGAQGRNRNIGEDGQQGEGLMDACGGWDMGHLNIHSYPSLNIPKGIATAHRQ